MVVLPVVAMKAPQGRRHLALPAGLQQRSQQVLPPSRGQRQQQRQRQLRQWQIWVLLWLIGREVLLTLGPHLRRRMCQLL